MNSFCLELIGIFHVLPKHLCAKVQKCATDGASLLVVYVYASCLCQWAIVKRCLHWQNICNLPQSASLARTRLAHPSWYNTRGSLLSIITQGGWLKLSANMVCDYAKNFANVNEPLEWYTSNVYGTFTYKTFCRCECKNVRIFKIKLA